MYGKEIRIRKEGALRALHLMRRWGDASEQTCGTLHQSIRNYPCAFAYTGTSSTLQGVIDPGDLTLDCGTLPRGPPRLPGATERRGSIGGCTLYTGVEATVGITSDIAVIKGTEGAFEGRYGMCE